MIFRSNLLSNARTDKTPEQNKAKKRKKFDTDPTLLSLKTNLYDYYIDCNFILINK